MKIFTYSVLGIGLLMIIINVLMLDFSQLFEGDSMVALIGIFAAICAMILVLILYLSKKIDQKTKSENNA